METPPPPQRRKFRKEFLPSISLVFLSLISSVFVLKLSCPDRCRLVVPSIPPCGLFLITAFSLSDGYRFFSHVKVKNLSSLRTSPLLFCLFWGVFLVDLVIAHARFLVAEPLCVFKGYCPAPPPHPKEACSQTFLDPPCFKVISHFFSRFADVHNRSMNWIPL